MLLLKVVASAQTSAAVSKLTYFYTEENVHSNGKRKVSTSAPHAKKQAELTITSEITQMMSLSQFPHIVEQSKSHNSYHTPNHIVQHNNTI